MAEAVVSTQLILDTHIRHLRSPHQGGREGSDRLPLHQPSKEAPGYMLTFGRTQDQSWAKLRHPTPGLHSPWDGNSNHRAGTDWVISSAQTMTSVQHLTRMHLYFIGMRENPALDKE